jgi:DNA polymerase III epsilon subunit-like protein
LDRLGSGAGKVFEEAREAFRVTSFHCAAAGFRHRGSTVIDPSRLSKYDRNLLKTAFQSIRRLIELTSSTFIGATVMTAAGPWTDDTPADRVRFVVLDTETTGLDPKRDRLITIGAVAVQAGQIVLADCFEAMLKLAYNNSSVTVHGVTRDEAREGMDEPEALKSFLEYLRDGVIVRHHIGHDIDVLNCAVERHFGETLPNRSVDTMDLTLNLEKDGAFAGRSAAKGFS